MAPAPPPPQHPDEKRLQAYYDADTKYVQAPVPTPLERDVAVAFINSHVNADTPPAKMRKLMRVAVFYDLRETAPAFASVLKGAESVPKDFVRSAMCLIALAWIGDPGQQGAARRYFHNLQERADVEENRDDMREVVEAFGPSEGTAAHRQWIQTAIIMLEGRLKQEESKNNVAGINLMREKIKELVEYLNVRLPVIERAFSFRQRIDAMQPPDRQIPPLVTYALGTIAGSSPEMSYWASMRLLRLDEPYRATIAEAFAGAQPENEMIHARALRAAEFFGYALSDEARAWLETQPDPGADPLVLRPYKYLP
jgi:hypothetical protein